MLETGPGVHDHHPRRPGRRRRSARTTYEGLPGDVAAGDQILIDDGKVRLRVTEVDGTDVHTEVVVGGRISNNKGINLPGVAVSACRRCRRRTSRTCAGRCT